MNIVKLGKQTGKHKKASSFAYCYVNERRGKASIRSYVAEVWFYKTKRAHAGIKVEAVFEVLKPTLSQFRETLLNRVIFVRGNNVGTQP